jgi:hypothetical protein
MTRNEDWEGFRTGSAGPFWNESSRMGNAPFPGTFTSKKSVTPKETGVRHFWGSGFHALSQSATARAAPEAGSPECAPTRDSCRAEIRRNSAETSWLSARYVYSWKHTATPIFFSSEWSSADLTSLNSAECTIRSTRPRQRTCMLSPSVISDGICNVSSTSSPSPSLIAVKRKAPRELRSCVKPKPSHPALISHKATGRLKAKRCPMRRSTATGDVMACNPLGSSRAEQLLTLAQSARPGKLKMLPYEKIRAEVGLKLELRSALSEGSITDETARSDMLVRQLADEHAVRTKRNLVPIYARSAARQQILGRNESLCLDA